VDRQAERGRVAEEVADLAGRNLDVEVRLGPDAADGSALRQQPLDQPEEGRALPRIVLEIVVVEEQDRVGIGGAGLFEGADDIGLGAQLAGVDAVAQAIAVLGHGFIDDVPADHAAAIAPGDGRDITIELGGEAGGGQGVGELVQPL